MEGQGPEHSSARLERFLAQAAEDNIQVVNLTTPAQYFHCLMRQALRPWRKPLVVMSPKSLLRHPKVVSSLDDLAAGSFQRVIADARFASAKPGKAKAGRVLLCTGKIYWELEEERERRKRDDVAIVRFEQLYPLSGAEFARSVAPFPDGTPAIWVQEEPRNMGTWRFLHMRYGHDLLGRFPLTDVCRPYAASPATGSASAHKLEQADLMERAFGPVAKPGEARNHA
jgi:2-oxoglutarate dehydrogenase E1 component